MPTCTVRDETLFHSPTQTSYTCDVDPFIHRDLLRLNKERSSYRPTSCHGLQWRHLASGEIYYLVMHDTALWFGETLTTTSLFNGNLLVRDTGLEVENNPYRCQATLMKYLASQKKGMIDKEL